MKKQVLTACIVLSVLSIVVAQNKYSRIKINLENRNIEEIAKLGLEADHGQYVPQQYLIYEYSDRELRILDKNGIAYELLIEDVQKFYREGQKSGAQKIIQDCNRTLLKSTHVAPAHFELGSMGGYYTYAETWQQLDKMRTKFPQLISSYQAIEPFRTFEGNPIRFLKIVKNPNSSSSAKPKTLFTALHHAREPLGLSQMIYFMWYLLENYEKNAEIKALLDHTELYFVPIVNPDGYLYNQQTNPEGGGMWRKNRRLNADSTYGVDLNRNYGFGWAADNSGSSPDPNSEVYRGESAFSEPESQALRALCEQYNFGTALNYHSFGNYLIYPFSYNNQPASPDFINISDHIAKQNNYVIGTSTQTVNYRTNGSSDDWMWGSANVYAMTPEVSSEGFWPDASRIQALCAESLNMNIRNAQIAGSYAVLSPISVPTITSQNATFSYEIQRLGNLGSTLFVDLQPQGNLISSSAETKKVVLNNFEKSAVVFKTALYPNVAEGTTLKWALTLRDSAGTFVHHDTINCIFGGRVVKNDSADDSRGWQNTGNNGAWGLSTAAFKSAPSSLSDSPSGKYVANGNSVMRTTNYILLPAQEKIYLRFWAKWDIERGADYAHVSISENNFGYQFLCGKHSRPGNAQQIDGEPIYDGYSDWVQEEIDLSDYAGKKVLLRFGMVSDFRNQRDGIYIDDIEIYAQAEDKLASETIKLESADFQKLTYPNPAVQSLRFNLEKEHFPLGLKMFSASGLQILETTLEQADSELDVSNLSPGSYYYQLSEKASTTIFNGKFIKI